MKGLLIILSGPSGVGKDTVLGAWQALNPDVVKVVSVTTRRPRPSEQEGKDYHFVTYEEFLDLSRQGYFLEHKEVYGQSYGTPVAEVDALLREGKIAVLKIDVQGALDVMAKRPDAHSAFLMPPSWDELERRIRSRPLEPGADIEERLDAARLEIALADRYERIIINRSVSEAASDLEEWVAVLRRPQPVEVKPAQ